jgi:hypothetical protein
MGSLKRMNLMGGGIDVESGHLLFRKLRFIVLLPEIQD